MRDTNIARLDQYTLPRLEIALDGHTRERVPVDRYTEFSWSVSRHAMFQRCRRQYYLNYYGARRVRDAKEPAVSAVWWLKQVTSLRAWLGSILHLIAQRAVEARRDERPVQRDALVEEALTLYRESVSASERGRKFQGRWVVLFEHVYPADDYSIDRDQAEMLIYDLTHTLLESDAYHLIKQHPPEAIKEIDEPFQSFTLSGVPRLGDVRVFAIPDVLLHHAGEITIIDWKTGSVEHESIARQAGIYQLYAHRQYAVPQDAIIVQIADLGDSGASVAPPGGVPSPEEALTFAHASIAEMVDVMESVQHNTVSIRHFPRTDNLALCVGCGFKRACWRHEVKLDE